jgi:uncharacterized membrane protein YukC
MNFYVKIYQLIRYKHEGFTWVICFRYRDPLFGIILIVALIFLISFFTYYYSIYKEKLLEKIIENYLKDLNLVN